MIKFLQNKGFISVEVVLLMGVVISLGTVLMTDFHSKTTDITDKTLEQMNENVNF